MADDRRRRLGLVALAALAVLAGTVVVVLTTSRHGHDGLVGEQAPALAGETLDGVRFDIGSHWGQWVVVNFFATWCEPCVREHPELVAFDKAHRTKGDAVLVSVLFANKPDAARAFLDRAGGGWPVIVDGGGSIATRYGVVNVPATYLVAPDGRVSFQTLGGVTQHELEQAMR